MPPVPRSRGPGMQAGLRPGRRPLTEPKKFSSRICSLIRRNAHTGIMTFHSADLHHHKTVQSVLDVPGPYPQSRPCHLPDIDSIPMKTIGLRRKNSFRPIETKDLRNAQKRKTSFLNEKMQQFLHSSRQQSTPNVVQTDQTTRMPTAMVNLSKLTIVEASGSNPAPSSER